jgi:3-isopropylmalate/(R)-2-methylmalate dehydratase small subunit
MRLSGSVLPLPFDDIDTDQIIPATYLTGVDDTGLGRYLFDGHVELTRRLEASPDATIAVALENFGCGSSREHALWALRQRGFVAVIAVGFSRIFLENSYNNGLVPVVLERESVLRCMQQPSLTIDVEGESVVLPDGTAFTFTLDALRKLFLLEGGYLRFVATRSSAGLPKFFAARE